MKINLKNTILALAAFAMVGGVGATIAVGSQAQSLITAFAGSDTVTMSAQGWGNAAAATAISMDHFSVSWSKGTNSSNAPKYYTSGSAVRAYGGNTFTVSANDVTLTRIVITFGGSDGSNAISTNVGSFASDTWTGSSDGSVVFTIGGTTGNRRISALQVTYATAEPAKIAVIELDGITSSVFAGDSGALSYSALDSDGNDWTGDVTFSSTDPTVISIDESGDWSALKAGTSVISVTADEKDADGNDVTDSLEVTVLAADTPTISLDYVTDSGTLEVFTGQGFLISATKTNLDSVTYSVSGTGSVEATQDGDDYSGTFTGAGSITITATGSDNTTTASLTFAVTASSVSSVVIKKGTSTYTSGSLQEDESLDLTASVSTVGTASTDVNWTSSAEGVATVSATGHVVGVSVGTATITATSVFDPTKSASCTITVKKDVFIPETNDVLTLALTGVSGTSYGAWEDKQSNSDAIYAGKNAGGNSSIQLRSKESDSGIVTTASGGYAISVSLEWESHTTTGRVVDVYGKDTAYSSAADLYNSATRGTLIGSITYGSGLPTSLAITSPYQFIGLRSHDGALYLSSLTIGWGDHCEDADVVAVDQFIRNYMHLDVTGQGTMQCKNEGWFEDAKDHFAGNVDKAITGLTAAQKDIILKSESTYKTISEKAWKYTDIRDRLVAWAEANQAVFNPETGVFSAASIGKWGSSSENSVASLMVILVTVGVVATGGMILLSKKRKRA